jgi:hypothetical protein
VCVHRVRWSCTHIFRLTRHLSGEESRQMKLVFLGARQCNMWYDAMCGVFRILWLFSSVSRSSCDLHYLWRCIRHLRRNYVQTVLHTAQWSISCSPAAASRLSCRCSQVPTSFRGSNTWRFVEMWGAVIIIALSQICYRGDARKALLCGLSS